MPRQQIIFFLLPTILICTVFVIIIAHYNTFQGRHRPKTIKTYGKPLSKGQTFLTNMTLRYVRNPGPMKIVQDVDCQQIIEGKDDYIAHVSELMKEMEYTFLSDSEIEELAMNCDKFLNTFDSNRFIVSKIELDFPIAYSILTYKDVVQIEKLLRAIYRPHNVYCIHMDRSSGLSLHNAIKAISKCLSNVFVASTLEDVIYEGYSRLKADLNCMSDLLNYSDVNWKYLINLPSQEYPLKTNSEIVKVLQTLNGTNSIESYYYEATHYRINQTYQENYKTSKLELTGEIKAPPPHNVTVAKGSAYGTFSRRFVEFALRNPKARDILKWTEDTLSPDETFWATLAFNKDLGAPGIQYSASGVPNPKSWITVGVMWESKGPAREVCHGMYVRNICVFGLGDLNKIVQEKTLFINKFYHYYQPFALMCIEEWYFNKTFSTVPFGSYYYNRLIKP
ncbi:N-acetyllactosaminide beta-1,6-N-acetylglucosaminyl-transferase-like [Crassostrea angulata]|uniref:N-acetyllactosaminide beta-1,6-N-acetylglucosaminyl-transferase-like n=1 Tax=Magallana angulata TaxID=2784310 RepID=UPI0022B09065|nr:N-acetyllactosaminide beta-1,6-N-acetylglucosaminyl-transferase-like [Crassostrea angulata]